MDSSKKNIHISIVSPVYNAENMVEELVQRITNSVKTITDNFEIILVEDCGPDNSWNKIKEICKVNEKVKGIKLSRNFGQHYAISAGIENTSGEWIVVLDCDLQDVPEEIPNLYNKAQEGYDIVLARRHDRKDTFLKRMSSKFFYKTLSYLTATNQDSAVANFGIYNYKVIDAVNSMTENVKYFPSMIKWVGFTKTSLNVKHSERPEGKSSYNLSKLLNLALDIILANSDKPLRLITKLGFFISAFSFLFAAIYFMIAVFKGFAVTGFASIIVSIWFFSGLIMFSLGIIGLYIGKTYEQSKNRPSYIIKQIIN